MEVGLSCRDGGGNAGHRQTVECWPVRCREEGMWGRACFVIDTADPKTGPTKKVNMGPCHQFCHELHVE